jgi:Leucine-rich repeat (LRR) protein
MLTRLRILNLKENRLVELPSSIGGCCALIELYLGFNALTALPDELGGCRELKTLDVRNNKMRELAPGVCNLKLNLLDLTNNDLT